MTGCLEKGLNNKPDFFILEMVLYHAGGRQTKIFTWTVRGKRKSCVGLQGGYPGNTRRIATW
ncbi:MAG: hypothetical protein G8345_00395 [Magnetococcales bacterium]|nr:hypothetical protein [Magnetococcales bacterium]NGZ25326.1 hypothetical protein [Magnetococcales bacterium]